MCYGCDNMPQISIQRKFQTNVFSYDVILKGNGHSVPVRAMFDTGATRTSISKRMTDVLGLVSLGTISGFAASGRFTYPKYIVCLELSENIIIPDLAVGGINIGENGYDVIIGMDVICQGELMIMRDSDKQTLIFQVDYTK